jgi:hypothetical protein
MRAFVLASVLLSAAAVSNQVVHQRPKGSFLVKAIEYKHRLRVCNAYPYAAPLDVYRNRVEKMTKDDPLPYKSCREFSSSLKAGDKLKFKVGDANAGTFSISDLPNTNALLLLVIHRHDTLTNAVSFESHVFASLLNAQIAVIDTYKGSEKAALAISDKGGKDSSRSEDLHYNSIVAVNSGDYNVLLKGVDGKVKSRKEMICVNKESYVILRVGVEAQQGQSYPQEITVFPHSAPPKWSSAFSHGPAALVMLVALFTC